MTEKVIGKTKILSDPRFMAWHRNGADFIHDSYLKKSKFGSKYTEANLNWGSIMFGGWFHTYFLILVFFTSIIQFSYANYGLIILSPFLLEAINYEVARILGPLFFLPFILLFLYLILNNLFNLEVQKVLRGKTFWLLFPLSACYRCLQKSPLFKRKRYSTMFIQHIGPINKKTKIFFVEQFVCADIRLTGDYKNFIASIEWSNGNRHVLAPSKEIDWLERQLFIVVLIIKQFFLGAWCAKRKITLHFSEIPKNGKIEIESF